MHRGQCVARGAFLLTELESKRVLSLYGIPTVETQDRAAMKRRRARQRLTIGYPVVLKVFSETITHKTDVGGVQAELCGTASGSISVSRHRGLRRGESRRRSTFRASPYNPWCSWRATS